MTEVLQVEFSGVLCQIDGIYILERKQLIEVIIKLVCYQKNIY